MTTETNYAEFLARKVVTDVPTGLEVAGDLNPKLFPFQRDICPLQLDVIRRAVRLWTNPGDLVLSPFAGIGSEGYVALELERTFVGVELKRSYYEQAGRNLAAAVSSRVDLFSEVAVEP